MKQVYSIDMEEGQYSKLLSELPPVDIVVTMGCNVQCPALPCAHLEDWGLDDPSGKDDGAFLAVMSAIEGKVLDLKRRIQAGELDSGNFFGTKNRPELLNCQKFRAVVICAGYAP